MKVKDLMTKRPAYATPDMELSQVAKLMADHDVGAIPVVENKDNKRVVGVVTDRDIATRVVAEGKNPLHMTAGEIMSTPVVTVKEDDDVRDVASLMEKNMVRRLPVIDEKGEVCGMVAQADIALKTSDKTTADMVQSVSRPTDKSSKV